MLARLLTLLSCSLVLASLPAQAQLLLSGPGAITFTATTGGAAPASQVVYVGHTGATAKTFTVSVTTASGGNWLTSSVAGGSTPSRFNVSANPAGLAVGTYSGTVTISSASVPSALIPVTLTVVASSQLSVSPNSLLFLRNTTSDITTGEQLLFVNASGSAINYRVNATTTDGGSWLLASSLAAATPGAVSVRVNAGGLTAGTYSGTVALSADGVTPVNIPVTLIVSASPFLTTSPTGLSFAVTRNGAPLTRQLSIAANGGTVPITTSASTTSGGNWLIAAPPISSAPGSIDVSVNPTGLAPGNYSGSVQINGTGAANPTVNVPVSLTVTDAATVNATPASIDTSYTVGSGAPLTQTQTINVAASAAGTNITAAAATFNGGPWLSLGPASLTAATAGQNNPVTVQIDATGLAPGQYRGSVTISGPGNSITVPVSLQVTNTASLAVDPTTVTFNFQRNQTPPSNQLVNITSSGAAYNYQTAITAGTPAGVAWLNGAATTGATPGLLTLSLNTTAASALPNGQYTATITTSGQPGIAPAPPNSPTVTVVLNVDDKPLFNVSPSAIDFAVPFGGATPASRLVTVTATDNSALAFTATAATTTGGNWLAVTPNAGTTPANISVIPVPTGLAPGIYEGSVSVTVPSISAVPQTVRVRLLVQSTVTIAPAPVALSFTQTRGGAAPTPQTVSITGTGNANYQVTVSTTAGGAWLSASPTSGSVPGAIQVSVNGTNLAAGTYSGSIGISSGDVNNSPVTIPVTLVVSSATLTVTPTAITLVAAPGSTQAVTQPLSIATSNATVAFTVTAATSTGGGNWLSVNPTGGTTPQTVTVSANPAGLAVGSYNGTVTVTVAGLGVVTVPVTLNIASTPTMVATPTSLSFDYTLGATLPASQNVSLATTGVNLSYIVTAAATTGGNWITATPNSGTTPSSITVAVAPGTLAPGTYNATVTVTSAASNSPVFIPVTFTVRPGRQLLSQIADGAGWKTSIILVNLDTAAATFTLRFYASDGTPLRLPFDGIPGALESLEGTIPVGGSRTLVTTGATAALSQGWAELTSTRLVSGLAVFRQTVTGRPDQEAGVPAIAASGRFVLPFDNTQNFVSSMALVNTNTSSARAVAVTPRDETGAALAGDSINLAARGHNAFVMSDRLPSIAGKRGVAEFNAAAGPDFSALGLRFNPGGAFTSLPALDIPATPGTRPANQIISQLVDGTGWKTSITLVNLDNVAAPFTLRFWRDDGGALSLPIEGITGAQTTLDGTIPAGGSRTIVTASGNTPLVQGWAELVTTRSIGGVAVFRQSVAGRSDFEAAVTLTTTTNKFVLPFDNTENLVTSMAITNINQVLTQNVNVIIRDELGVQIGADTVPLGGRAHTAFTTTDRFPATRNRRGVIEFTSASPDITGLGLRFNPGGAFTSFPVLPKP